MHCLITEEYWLQSIPLLPASFFRLVAFGLNLFCLLSIRSAVAQLLKPLLGGKEGERREETGEEEGGEEKEESREGYRIWSIKHAMCSLKRGGML